jgi:hypothetical protein
MPPIEKEEDVLCGSCKHHGVTTVMKAKIWETWDGQTERWGYSYVCPVCGREGR